MAGKGLLKIGLVAAAFGLMIFGGHGFLEATGALQGTTATDSFMEQWFRIGVYALVFASAGFPLRAAVMIE